MGLGGQERGVSGWVPGTLAGKFSSREAPHHVISPNLYST